MVAIARSGLTAATRPAMRAFGRPAAARAPAAARVARALPANESGDTLAPAAPATPAPAVRPAAPSDYAKATIKVRGVGGRGGVRRVPPQERVVGWSDGG